MRQTTLATLLCSMLVGTAHAAPDSHAGEVNPPKKVFPDLFSDKSQTKSTTPHNTAGEKSEGKPFANAPAITTVAPVVTAPKPVMETPPKAAKTSVTPTAKHPDATSKKALDATSAKRLDSTSKKASAAPASDQASAVVKTVEAWAAAWSAKDTDKYLAFYTADFHTPDGTSRTDWEHMRRERIGKPAHIHVNAQKIRVDFADESHATVKFHQSYQASNLNSADSKIMLMVKSGDTWLIQEERKK